jgi:hypothetical protein
VQPGTYDVALFGDLLFDEKGLRAWKRSSVSSVGVRAIAQAFPKQKNDPPAKVVTIFGELPRVGFFQVEEHDGFVRVRGHFHGLAFQKRARQLAALFMSAAQFGGQGTITFLGEGVWLGYEIFLDRGRAKLRPLAEDEVRRAAQDPALDVISGHFEAAAERDPSVARRSSET